MTRSQRAAELVAQSPIVEITGLHVAYVRHRTAVPAVEGFDLTIGRGEVVAVVGESGSGKTTTANAVIGLLPDNGRITSGSVVVDGIETAGRPDRVLRRLRGSVVGLIPQDPMVGLNPTQRIGAQVAEAVRLRGVRGAAVDAEVVELLEQAGLDHPETRARQYPHQLSGGLCQRALIAIALAGRPQLIIADEPTSALDVTVQQRILDHLEGLVREQGISLLIITHDLAVAADRADRVVVMQHGRIVEQGTPEEILGSPREAYTRKLIGAAPGLAHGGRIVPRFAETTGPAAGPVAGPVAGPAAGPGAAGSVEPRPAAGSGAGSVDAKPLPIISLEHVSKVFDAADSRRGSRGFNALDDVSIEVARGQTHALVGESGCGKTTTLRIAMGLEQPTSGRVILEGRDVTGLGWREARPLRRAIQLVHQNPFASLDPRFTVRESIVEPLVSFKVGTRGERAARARELLDQVALPASYADRLPAELSGGQRQRVAIARALALSPALLMLDEPVSALDVSVQEQILELLTGLQADLGLSYVFVSHDLAVVAQVSHTVSVLHGGRIVESGPVGQVFGSPRSEHTAELLAAIPGRRGARQVEEVVGA